MDELPADLQRIIQELVSLLLDEIEALAESFSVDRVAFWQATSERLLARYHIAAYMVGAGTASAERAKQEIVDDLQAQLAFLQGFADSMRNVGVFDDKWLARIALYAESVKIPYWRGATEDIPLPAVPGEGSLCFIRCRCAWEIDIINADLGDYDAYWRRGKSDSCQTCLEREQLWSPIQIRSGGLI